MPGKTLSRIEISKVGAKSATFEDAIAETGFGKFNVFLISISALSCLSQFFEAVNVAYVSPIAQCDLDLSLEEKGLLNGITYIGMITSGFLWGYLCDAIGRKVVIVYGYYLSTVLAIFVAFSNSTKMLIITKFFTGLIINGPFTASVAHITEFHSKKYRSRVQMTRGVIFSISNILLPILAWGILPRTWNFSLGRFQYHSWNLFLLACAVPPLLAAVTYSFFPESPKYLMSMGRNEEALEIFKKVFALNSGRSTDDYPVKVLFKEVDDKRNVDRNFKQVLRDSILQMKPLFQLPYLPLVILACGNAFCLATSSSTTKLWLPQIFQAITDYKYYHNSTGSNLCDMLEELTPSFNNNTEVCTVNLDNISVYIDSIIVGLVRFATAICVSGYVIKVLGSKKLAIILLFATGCLSGGLYFSQNSETVLVLSSLISGVGSSAEIVITNITIELVPTTFRTMAISLHLLTSRIGTFFGNLVFPYLLYTGCAPPFIFISMVALGCAALSLFYPNTKNKNLK